MGMPLTKLVRLRLMRQVRITTSALQWGYVSFHPNQMQDPFNLNTPSSGTAVVVDTGYKGRNIDHKHYKLQFLDKEGNPFVTGEYPQPNGYDQWLAVYPEEPHPPATADFIAGQGQFKNYTVLRSRFTLTVMPNASDESSDNLIAGWAKEAYPAFESEGGLTFTLKHARCGRTEVSQMLSTKIIKAEIMGASRTRVGLGKSFTFNWDLAKWKRKIRRRGYRDEPAAHSTGATPWSGTWAAKPKLMPIIYFIISDIAGATAVPVSFMLTIDYDVKLTDRIIGDDSTFGTTTVA